MCCFGIVGYYLLEVSTVFPPVSIDTIHKFVIRAFAQLLASRLRSLLAS
jgi:hypothetical protein